MLVMIAAGVATAMDFWRPSPSWTIRFPPIAFNMTLLAAYRLLLLVEIWRLMGSVKDKRRSQAGTPCFCVEGADFEA